MKKLTVEYIKSLGFKLEDTVHEDEFYYEDYTLSSLEICLTIWFNYYKDGKVTYEVDFDGYDLINVGELELEVLLKVLPKKEITTN